MNIYHNLPSEKIMQYLPVSAATSLNSYWNVLILVISASKISWEALMPVMLCMMKEGVMKMISFTRLRISCFKKTIMVTDTAMHHSCKTIIDAHGKSFLQEERGNANN